jgi:uncharacterized membrane protein YfcA
VSAFELLAGVATGVAGGFVSGLLGVTSGGLLVPAGVLLLGLDQHVAQGVSLVAQAFPTSLSGFLHYRLKGHLVTITSVAVASAGFLAGGVGGALLAGGMGGRALQGWFVAYLGLLCIVVMVHSGREGKGGPEAAAAQPPLPMLAVVGLVGGVSSGFLGIGGGLAIAVLGTVLCRMPQLQAQALSLALTTLPLTLPAAWTYVRGGVALPWLAVAGIVVGLWVGTLAGSKVATRLPAHALRRGLISLLIAMTAAMAWRAAH